MNWFKSLPLVWQIIVITIIILIIYWLYKKYKIAFQPKQIDPSLVFLSNGQSVVITDPSQLPEEKKIELQSLAEAIKKDIYGANITHEMSLYKKASGYSDVEIDFLAQYYKKQLTNGVSLYEDMNNELVSCFIQDCSGWETLITKLEKTGNR